MEKQIIMLFMLMLLGLTACGDGKETTITIPTDLSYIKEDIIEEDKERVREELKEFGATNITFEDKQYSFTVIKKNHEEMLQSIENDIEEAFTNFAEGDYDFLVEMEIAKDFKDIYITVAPEELTEDITKMSPITLPGTHTHVPAIFR